MSDELEFRSTWEQVDYLLDKAHGLIELMKSENEDHYGLLESARIHVAMARIDLDADLK